MFPESFGFYNYHVFAHGLDETEIEVDEYEKDDFIVDDVDEDEQDAYEHERADIDDERKKNKKRSKINLTILNLVWVNGYLSDLCCMNPGRESKRNNVLDEDDCEFLQDNIIGIRHRNFVRFCVYVLLWMDVLVSAAVYLTVCVCTCVYVYI